ncbi:cytochrome P450 [Actinophytocola sp.]|uniref:cytochrome P450 n=1 Tax=Actinophytocola sp. TaxID=1872138 RepID=UPI003899974B
MTTLPPGPTTPHLVQALIAILTPHRGMRQLRRRYGDAFMVKSPVFGRALVISDPAEIKQLFQTGTDIAENVQPNLGRVLGPGSMFALTGDDHRAQRKLLVPPFHGRRLAAMERIVEDETVREMATWPEGRPFPVLPSTMRITLNAILRAVFGAEGAEFERLRELLPRLVALGSGLVLLPTPRMTLPNWTPWGRFRALRREYDVVVNRLIDKVAADPDLEERNDVLAMMLQSSYDDGSRLTRGEIADQLLTLLAAGHETTATTLAWAVERLRRHPAVLRALAEEVDAGGRELRDATIIELQRIRPVIDAVGRNVRTDGFRLGRWTLPKGMNVLVSIDLIHDDPAVFPNPRTFDPSRFTGKRPDLYQWIPFGGGTRRCIGAAFATMEMNVVLRTMLRDFTLAPTGEPDERWHSRGVANAPAKGGIAVVHRRRGGAVSSSVTASTGAEA